MRKKPVMLMILDGWGIAPPSSTNAVTRARTPHLDYYFNRYPHSQLRCSGEAVGLPEGQMGNSEVGHLSIGSGRIIYQSLTRISRAVKDGSLEKNPVLVKAMEEARDGGKKLHLLGLLSDGGVHSHIDHLLGLLAMAQKMGVEKSASMPSWMDGIPLLKVLLPSWNRWKKPARNWVWGRLPPFPAGIMLWTGTKGGNGSGKSMTA